MLPYISLVEEKSRDIRLFDFEYNIANKKEYKDHPMTTVSDFCFLSVTLCSSSKQSGDWFILLP